MKPASLFVFFPVAALMSAAVIAASTMAQTPQSADGSHAPAHVYPAPTNLKVLPKDLTGGQVRDIMEDWANDLGTDCSTCHVRDPKDLAPNGRPRFSYADDSKEEKATARVMYAMVESINTNFVAKVPNSGMPVTCGTCHRGHLSPEPFTGPDDTPAGNKGSLPTGNKTASPR